MIGNLMAQWLGRFDGQLHISAPLTNEQLCEVPAKRGVLALLGEGDRPIVLLTAANVRARLRGRLAEPQRDGRRKTVDLRTVTRKVLWKLATSHFETDLAFFEIARRIWPKTYGELLAWRPAWLVHVDAEQAYPRFVRTREASGAGGRYFGPFNSARAAESFIEAIHDAFGLCRDYTCLRQSPHSQRCAYAEMGRCLSPCDGTISMGQYRHAVARAADFAAGRRRAFRRRLEEQMKQAADRLDFERAGTLKTRLDRLGELDGPSFAHVRPLEEFQYVIVQSGGGAGRAKVFLANGGEIAAASPLDYPPDACRLEKTLRRMARHCARPAGRDRTNMWRMGLVAQYLFCSPERRGLILHWDRRTTAEKLADAIEEAREHLKLRAPTPPGFGRGAEKASN